MIRIRLGIVLRSSEITTLENAVIPVTERPITLAGSSLAVTAKAEQIPNTGTVTGLFSPSGEMCIRDSSNKKNKAQEAEVNAFNDFVGSQHLGQQ